MADSTIAQYLNKILEAVYGKDVRRAIFDSISQCYEDVNNPSLNNDAIMDALQKKIDDGELAAMTIADESITERKLAPDARLWHTQKLSIISNEYQNSGYSGELFNQFGANINIFTDYIDTSNYKTLYYRIYRFNLVGGGTNIGIKIGCYDVEKNYLYTMHDSTGDYAGNF